MADQQKVILTIGVERLLVTPEQAGAVVMALALAKELNYGYAGGDPYFYYSDSRFNISVEAAGEILTTEEFKAKRAAEQAA